MQENRKEYGVAVLGFGTVGAGVVEGLLKNADLLRERTGLSIALRGVADLDIVSNRGIDLDDSLLTTDASALIAREDVDIVVELIGGEGVAKTLILDALSKGKDVVTANKALLAKFGAELYDAAYKAGSDLFYEAAVGGGIPIVKVFREGLVANHVNSIHGILNGTCNYILTRMEKEKKSFDEILSDAQELGFAEAEPSLDVDGWDTAHKAAILASLAYGFAVDMDQMCVEGLRGIEPYDLDVASSLGYKIKLLAIVKPDEEGADVRVHPALIPEHHMLASVSGVFNAVLVNGDMVGDTLYYGPGAGREATASSVIADIVDVARNLVHESSGRLPALHAHRTEARVSSPDKLVLRYYVRLSLLDEPGSLAQLAAVLADHGIGIASLVQRDSNEGHYVPVIVLTAAAREADMKRALDTIVGLDVVEGSPVRIRVEELA